MADSPYELPTTADMNGCQTNGPKVENFHFLAY